MKKMIKGGVDAIVTAVVITVIIVALLVVIIPNLSDSSKNASEDQVRAMTHGQARISVSN